jgi:mRNA-degrading endonuclease toxin of MazEF toxin-antitoxin module
MAVLLSWDSGLAIRDRVIVAPITSQIRGLDAEVLLDHRDGMPESCVVNCDILATVFYSSVKERVTLLSEDKIRRIERAIHEALGMELPCTVA